MKQILIPFLLVAFLVSGCEYQKVLKKGTAAQKFEAAKKYYKKEDFNRALPLLDELLGVFKRRADAEEVYYLYAYTHYGLGDHRLAGYHFKNFTEKYRRSIHLEEAAYMYARCEFHSALPWQLDQTNTKKAIEKLQLFINTYPKSKYIEQCNELMDELRAKLHKKAYNNSMLYYNIGDYRSAVVSFKNAIQDYPDLPQKNEVEFLTVKSSFLYAERSVLKVQQGRYEECIEYCKEYLAEHDSKEDDYSKVQKLEKEAREAINKLSINFEANSSEK